MSPLQTYFLSIISLLIGALPAYSQLKQKPSEKYNYLAYTPKNYNSTKKKYPLVIYLHGGSMKGNDLNKLKGYGPPKAIEKGQNFEFLIVSPQCPEGKTWASDNWLEPLYSELLSKYRIDEKRVYLTGISMGGYGTWQTAVAYPDKFAAIAPLCGGCDDSTQICRIKKLPVWAFHGTDDDIIPFGISERLVKSLKDCGGKVKFSALKGEGHSIEHLYEKREIYDWLLTNHK